MNKKINKSIDLSDIPQTNRGYDWKNCIGHKIRYQYDDKEGTLTILDYNKEDRKVLLEYEKYQKWISVYHLAECKIGELLGKNTKRFKYDIGDTLTTKYSTIVITNRKYEKRKHGNTIVNEKLYQYKCLKCGFDCGENYKNGIFYPDCWSLENDLLYNGSGCALCCDNPQRTVVGINDIPTTAPWMISYFQGGKDEAKKYTKSSSQEIYPKCPHCGKIKSSKMKINTIDAMNGIGCDCGDGVSFPEKYLSNLLDQLQVKYIRELTKSHFSWCDKYRYDFYLIDYNIIIETHGMQHYKDTKFGRTLVEEQENDRIKEKLAKENGITEYIVIDCRYSDAKWISESIRNSLLSNLFDLNSVSFSLCAEYANCNNLCKDVCEYYGSNQNVKITDIANTFNISTTTVYSYLKNGNEIGWCNYEYKGKIIHPIYVYTKDMKYVNKYPSRKILFENSLKDLGCKIAKNCLQDNLLGKRTDYKGYIFSYTPLHQESQNNDSLLLCSNE